MFKVKRNFYIEAAHSLPGYNGECSNIHGHRWRIQVCLASDEQDKNGISIDFKWVKEQIGPLIMMYDHADLNQFFINPSAENLAVKIFDDIEKILPEGLYICSVTVQEGRDTEVTYVPD